MTDTTFPQPGGCLCGRVRYAVTAKPYFVALCACRFCQRMLGSDYNVEPMFRTHQFTVTDGTPQTYTHVSEGSGQPVHVHFCAACGSSLFLRPERFPDCVGVFAGSFDNPDWFPRDAEITAYFFVSEAPKGMMLAAGIDLYQGHAKRLDGSMNDATRLDAPRRVGE